MLREGFLICKKVYILVDSTSIEGRNIVEEEKMQSSSEAENPAASPVGAHMPFLKGLAGLKAVMLLLLFWWHLPQKPEQPMIRLN